MKKGRTFLLIFSLLFSISMSGGDCDNDTSPKDKFIRRKENKLVVGEVDTIIWLRGINFNNYHWLELGAKIINSDHHSEIDFKRVTEMGMNVIRFNLSYVIFEEDAPYVYTQEGWDWLDQNISWAKKHGVYLILDMHVPQGGYQGGTNEGLALWNDIENQNRLIALWKTIADRYQNEPIVAGYNLVNEPTPPDSVEQWSNLAQALIDEIRSVDQNHLIIVEKVHTVYHREDISEEDPITQFIVNDNNVMYEFHFYYPDEYTHQNDPYTIIPEDGTYPDEGVYYLPWTFEVEEDISNNPPVPNGNSDWSFYEGELYKITNPAIIGGYPTLSCFKNQGTVYYDDFMIKEYDENKQFVRDIFSIDLTSETDIASGYQWVYWSEDGSGTFNLSDKTGHNDTASLSIAGVSQHSNWTNLSLGFETKQGYYYQISGWMKGVDTSCGAICDLRIEFVSSPSGIPIYRRNKNYLEYQLLKWRAFGEDNNVPINVGEFGLYKNCFTNNKGGLTWVADMLDLLDQNDVHFNFYDYHSEDYGLFKGGEGENLPDPLNVNQELIDLLKDFLLQPKLFNHVYSKSFREDSENLSHD